MVRYPAEELHMFLLKDRLTLAALILVAAMAGSAYWRESHLQPPSQAIAAAAVVIVVFSAALLPPLVGAVSRRRPLRIAFLVASLIASAMLVTVCFSGM